MPYVVTRQNWKQSWLDVIILCAAAAAALSESQWRVSVNKGEI